MGATQSILSIELRRIGRLEEAESARAVVMQVARRLQTHCSGPNCHRMLRPEGAPLDVCVKCRCTLFCGKACQTADWLAEGGHRAECKALIAEGKAVAAAAAAAEAASVPK